MSIHMIKMPKWGLSMEQGQVNGWLKQIGDKVSKGDELLDVETEKISSGVECAVDGVLRRQIAVEGETLPVGALLAVVADADVSDAQIDEAVAAFQRDFVPAAAVAADTGPQPHKRIVGSHTIRYLKQGDGGVPVLLIHGFGGDLNNWLFNHAELAARRAVWALDLPGHGESSKPLKAGTLDELAQYVCAFMREEGIERAHLAGHSMGGAVALQIASVEPQRVASLALIASAGLGREIDAEYIDGFVAETSRNTLKPHLLKLFADPALVTRQLIEDIVKYKRLDGVNETLAKIAAAMFGDGVQQHVYRDRLAELAPRTLVLWGSEDRIIPSLHAQGLPAGVQSHVIEGKGHMVQMEAAAEVNRVLNTFFGD